MSTRAGAIAAFVACGAVAGCAGGGGERPTEELTRARTLVETAERAGAQRFAAADLEQARDKLQQAESVAEDDAEQARKLALEAAVDAELAAARTSSAEAQQAAAEVARSVETLRKEAQRGGGQQQPPPGQ